MDTEFGFMPLPDEGTELYGPFEKCEECSATRCQVEAPDPYAAEVMGRDAYWPWCPGYCAECAWRTLELFERWQSAAASRGGCSGRARP